MDLTIPLTAGGVAAAVGGFLGRQVWKYIGAKIARYDLHLIEFATNKAVVSTEIRGMTKTLERIESKVDRLQLTKT